MIDLTAFNAMQYGLYLISTADAKQAAGCVINTVTQATVSPARLLVIVNKENHTAQLLRKSGFFAVVPLLERASMELIGTFGFQSSVTVDKFAPYATQTDENGVPFVCEQVAARFSCRVVETMDAGTHFVFLGEATHAETLSSEPPMTYAYYHKVKKGLTPPKASSYIPPTAASAAPEQAKTKGWRCKVCGYMHEDEILPNDFVCPVCKQGRAAMEPLS